jgi:hypothetical protein
MRSGGTGSRARNIGINRMYNGRRKKDNWGKKRSQKCNGRQQFSNRRAKIITGGTQEVSLEVVSDQ